MKGQHKELADAMAAQSQKWEESSLQISSVVTRMGMHSYCPFLAT